MTNLYLGGGLMEKVKRVCTFTMYVSLAIVAFAFAVLSLVAVLSVIDKLILWVLS